MHTSFDFSSICRKILIFRFRRANKDLFPSFLENHEKSQEITFLKTHEKQDNDEKMLPMVILGQNKYNNSMLFKFSNFFFQFYSNFCKLANFERVLQVEKIELENGNFYHILLRSFCYFCDLAACRFPKKKSSLAHSSVYTSIPFRTKNLKIFLIYANFFT